MNTVNNLSGLTARKYGRRNNLPEMIDKDQEIAKSYRAIAGCEDRHRGLSLWVIVDRVVNPPEAAILAIGHVPTDDC